jgi:hypothetical protein
MQIFTIGLELPVVDVEFRFSTFLALTGVGLLVIRALRIGRRPDGYPPGPPAVPILGNIHQVFENVAFEMRQVDEVC